MQERLGRSGSCSPNCASIPRPHMSNAYWTGSRYPARSAIVFGLTVTPPSRFVGEKTESRTFLHQMMTHEDSHCLLASFPGVGGKTRLIAYNFFFFVKQNIHICTRKMKTGNEVMRKFFLSKVTHVDKFKVLAPGLHELPGQ